MVGFGQHVTGGIGGEVYEVTETSDGYGPGTLRYASKQAYAGPRTIVFKVPEVLLAQPVMFDRRYASRTSYQSDNPKGTTVKGSFWPAGYGDFVSNPVTQVVIRGLRFRGTMSHGPEFNPETGGNPLQCYGIRGLLVVGNSISGGQDQCLNFQHCAEATALDNIISESALKGEGGQSHREANHNFGGHSSHSKGGVSFLRNLWINHRTRTPSVDGPHPVQLINNWIQGFEIMAAESFNPSESNVIANVWVANHLSRQGTYPGAHNLLRNEPKTGVAEHAPHLRDNWYIRHNEKFTDQQRIFELAMPHRNLGWRIFPYEGMPEVNVLDPETLQQYIRDNVGVFPRDNVDLRAIADMVNNTGRYGIAGFEEDYGPVAPPLDNPPDNPPDDEPPPPDNPPDDEPPGSYRVQGQVNIDLTVTPQ